MFVKSYFSYTNSKDGDFTMREKKEINIQIGEQIKLAREKARLTQESLAERIEVSPQYVSDLERGVVGVSITTLKRICTALCVSADQLLFGLVAQDRSAALADQCKALTDEQFHLLSEIAEKFAAAVQSAK